MSTLITVLHVIVCLLLMLTVLLQSGKSGMGGAFGGGNTQTVFGGGGASTFLRKLTATCGTVFMVTSMVLAFIASRNAGDFFDSFVGKEQARAGEKERAIEEALSGQHKSSILPSLNSLVPGSGSGAGSATSSPAPGPSSPIQITPAPTPTPTPAAPPAGSAAAPKP